MLARPTTVMPMTAPPLKATSRAGARPMRAAAVVRTLAFVATRMPAQPATADATAPSTKERAMSGLRASSPSLAKARSTATMTTKPARTLYSARRKAMAPT